MKLLVLTVLLAAVAVAAAVEAVVEDAEGEAPTSLDSRVSCLPCRPEDAARVRCRALRPEQCRSRKVQRCGCCDACVVSLEEGDFCIGAIPTNGVCEEPKRCMYNLCTSSS